MENDCHSNPKFHIMTRIDVALLFLVLAAARGGVIHDGTRIVNGQNVALGEIPYQVSLQLVSNNLHFCGGSVLNSNYVITAAHCVDETDPRTIKVIAGTIHKDQPQATHRAIDIRVHRDYNPSNSWINDIALIKVETPFQFSKNISAVKLPTSNANNNAGKTAVVSGWGDLHENGPSPNTLQKVEVKIADQEYCRNVYVKQNLAVRDTQICAHDTLEEHGSCHGDSGGPLTIDGILVGLVSWAMGCSRVNYPTVFTRVSSYIDWIEEHFV